MGIEAVFEYQDLERRYPLKFPGEQFNDRVQPVLHFNRSDEERSEFVRKLRDAYDREQWFEQADYEQAVERLFQSYAELGGEITDFVGGLDSDKTGHLLDLIGGISAPDEESRDRSFTRLDYTIWSFSSDTKDTVQAYRHTADCAFYRILDINREVRDLSQIIGLVKVIKDPLWAKRALNILVVHRDWSDATVRHAALERSQSLRSKLLSDDTGILGALLIGVKAKYGNDEKDKKRLYADIVNSLKEITALPTVHQQLVRATLLGVPIKE